MKLTYPRKPKQLTEFCNFVTPLSDRVLKGLHRWDLREFQLHALSVEKGMATNLRRSMSEVWQTSGIRECNTRYASPFLWVSGCVPELPQATACRSYLLASATLP